MDREICPKHVEFYSQNKFEKLVHLDVFIIRILFASCISPAYFEPFLEHVPSFCLCNISQVIFDVADLLSCAKEFNTAVRNRVAWQ
jgi:hypothetical protein